jgi:CubicO group peptidase (beta-lactamase class C family)
MSIRSRAASLLAVLLLIGLIGPSQGRSQQSYADLESRVDEIMAEYAGHDGPGAVVAVVRGGAVRFAKGYGLANLQNVVPLTRATVLDVGSVAKQFTAFAIVLLAQDGKLSLDEDIRTYLPSVPDFGSTITVRHLVHHMSGLREIYGAESLAGYQSGDGIAQHHAQQLTSRMRELNFEPGTEHLYCNTGYMLLADIVAEVSGKSFPEFMAERVFGPVGMTHTTIMSQRGQVVPGSGESYGPHPDDGYARLFDNSGIQGAGGIYTTIDDLAAWMSNYGTAAVGGADAIEQMQQRGVLANGDTLVYAFGLSISEYRGLRRISHGGSSAGYRASFDYFPDVDGGVITMSNFAAFDGTIPRRISEVAFGEHFGPAPATQPAGQSGVESDPESPTWTPSAMALQDFAGRYFSSEIETMYTLVVEDGKLIAKHRRHDDVDFEADEPDSFSSSSFFGDARFERDDGGEITGMRVSNGRVRNLLFVRVGG